MGPRLRKKHGELWLFNSKNIKQSHKTGNVAWCHDIRPKGFGTNLILLEKLPRRLLRDDTTCKEEFRF